MSSNTRANVHIVGTEASEPYSLWFWGHFGKQEFDEGIAKALEAYLKWCYADEYKEPAASAAAFIAAELFRSGKRGYISQIKRDSYLTIEINCDTRRVTMTSEAGVYRGHEDREYASFEEFIETFGVQRASV